MKISAWANNRKSYVFHRARLPYFVCASVILLITGGAAYAADECTGVTGCVSVRDSEPRIIPRQTVTNYDVYCTNASAPYLWDWDVVPAKSTQAVDISSVKIYRDQRSNDNGLRLRIENADPKHSAHVRIDLGCSAQPFPYVNVGRRMGKSFRSE